MAHGPPLARAGLMGTCKVVTVQESPAQSISQAPCIPTFLHPQPVHGFYTTPLSVSGLSISAFTESPRLIHHTIPHLESCPWREGATHSVFDE